MPRTKANDSSKRAKLIGDAEKQEEKKQSRNTNSSLSAKKDVGKGAKNKTPRPKRVPVKKKDSSDENDFDMDSSPPIKQTEASVKCKGKYLQARSAAKMTRLKRKKDKDEDDTDQPVKKSRQTTKTKQIKAKESEIKKDVSQEREHQETNSLKTSKNQKTSKSVDEKRGLIAKKISAGKSSPSIKVENESECKQPEVMVLSKGKYRPARTAVNISRAHRKKDDTEDTEQPVKNTAKIKVEKQKIDKGRKSQEKEVTTKPSKSTDDQSKKRTTRKTKQTAEKGNNSSKNKKGKLVSTNSHAISNTVTSVLKKEDLKKEDLKKEEPSCSEMDNAAVASSEDKDGDQVDEMSSDGSSESEWEEVEDLPMQEVDPSVLDGPGPSESEKPKEAVEISIEVSGGNTLRSKRRQKHEEMWRRYLQWQVNKHNKELQEDMHKVHLLCLLANGLQSSALCNDMELQGLALSHMPASWMPRRHGQVDTQYLQKFMKWFEGAFKLWFKPGANPLSCPTKTKLMHTLQSKTATSYNELVYICILILRAIGLDVRLVISLRPMTIKAIKLTKANKRVSKSKETKSPPGSSKASTSKATKKAPSSSGAAPSKATNKTLGSSKAAPSKATKKIEHSKTKPVCSKFFQSPNDKPSTSSTSKQSNKGNLKLISGKSSSERTKSNPIASKKTKAGDSQTQENKKSEVKSLQSGPKPKNRQQRKCASKVKSIIELSGDESSSEDYQVLDSESDGADEKSEILKKKATKRTKRNTAVQNKRSSNLSDSDYEEPLKTTSNNRRKPNSKTRTKNTSKPSPAGNSSVEELDGDSDFEVEVIKVASGPRRSSAEGSAKKKSKKVLSSESDESVEIVKTKGEGFKPGFDNWLEVYCASEGAWICIGGFKSGGIHVKRPDKCGSGATQPIRYVVTFDNEGSIKDVSHRYDSKWMIGTQKLRVDPEWWQQTLVPFRTRNEIRDMDEDEQLEGKLLNKPLPTTVSEYKSHPLYALRRHLLKFEAIYPNTAAILGYCRGEAVFARECVRELHTRQTWLKQARVVRIGEKPYKMVKARPKRGQLQETEPSLEIFGNWQTEEYIPPIAVDGVVPRNEHGNVELFKECMLPGGTVHLKLLGLNRIARKLEIDCAPAMTGWDFHGGFCHPVLDGFVVCEEYEDILKDAWHKEQQEMEKRKRKKKEERALKNWKLLIKGVLIRERLNKRFQVNQGASTSSPSKSKAKNTEKVSWPKNRMTAFEGDKSNRLPFETL